MCEVNPVQGLTKEIQRDVSVEIGQTFALVAAILQGPEQFFEAVREETGLSEKIKAMLLVSLTFLAIYGLALGSGHPLQALSAAIKLPFVFLGGLITCAPTLYVFDLLLGARRSLSQTVAVLLLALTTTAVLLFSFVPITVALRLMVNGYQFFKLLNVGFVAIASLAGVFFLAQGLRKTLVSQNKRWSNLLYLAWCLLFMLIVSQIAWSLRPFFHYPGATFSLFAGSGNLLGNLGGALGELFGFWVVR